MGRSFQCAECGGAVRSGLPACGACGAPKAVFEKDFKSEEIQTFEFPDPKSQLTAVSIDRGRTSAGLWARYLAKQVDFLVFFIPAFLVMVLVVSVTAPFFGMDADDAFEGAAILVGLIWLLAYALLEALCISMFGSTLGKMLLGIRLRKKVGGKLNAGTSIIRSVRACVEGLGLGIPLIGLFTHISAFSFVKQHGATGWDRDAGAVYESEPVGPFRWVSGVFLALLAIGMFAAVAASGVGSNY